MQQNKVSFVVVQVYTPEELLRMHHLPPSGRYHAYKGRKRGRPRGDEAVLSAIKAAEDHAKKLRTEFGLTGAQVNYFFVDLEKQMRCNFVIRSHILVEKIN
jgi:hypothetical protein